MFSWDEIKRLGTIEKHGIDFRDAAEVLLNDPMILQGKSDIEDRYIAIGPLRSKLIAVVFTMRDGNYRIITARRARANEEARYKELLAGRDTRS